MLSSRHDGSGEMAAADANSEDAGRGLKKSRVAQNDLHACTLLLFLCEKRLDGTID